MGPTLLEKILTARFTLATGGTILKSLLLEDGLVRTNVNRVLLREDAEDQNWPHCNMDVSPFHHPTEQLGEYTLSILDKSKFIVSYLDRSRCNSPSPVLLWDWQQLNMVYTYHININASGPVSLTIVQDSSQQASSPLAGIRPGHYKWLRVLWRDRVTGKIEEPSIFPEDDSQLDEREEDYMPLADEAERPRHGVSN